MASVSVVIPVKDGAEHLEEVLAAVVAQGPDEVLVIDSGSTDGSLEIARAAGVPVLEIPPEEFGHGRTRNLAAESTSGELICFLTQDATPVDGWLDAYRRAFAADPLLGAAFGPHLPRPDTSPMIARELTEFFARLSPGEPFLSNVNAAYRRACWEEIRFRDVPYSEDQAFGRDLMTSRWLKAYLPKAGVLHAHDYGAIEFMRRYFDEYRGLRETTGHVEPLNARSIRAEVAADRRWMKEHGDGATARWTARSAIHHGGRKVFSALGSRSHRLPGSVQRALSLEGRASGLEGKASGLRPQASVAGSQRSANWAISRYLLDGPAALLDPLPADRTPLHIAVLVPPFRIGSGGHNTIFQVTSRLERMGHTCSIWIVPDPVGMRTDEWPGHLRGAIREHFAPVDGPVFKGFDDWYGADVVFATGWQTAHPAMLLDNARSRVYFVNDHEPEFYGTSIERTWAEDTYRMGMYAIAASPWLRDLLIDRYGAHASAFQLGVDHDTYKPQEVERRRDTVIFYSRTFTGRRAVSLGLIALEELKRRRPDTRVVLYGNKDAIAAPFEHENIGVASPDRLAREYSEATVGLCLSMTNFSLIPKEMMACGLPCVELAGISAESIFGPDGGPLELADADPVALADAMERLLADRGLWERRSREGIDAVASHTWDVAARETEAGIRHALRERERETAAI